MQIEPEAHAPETEDRLMAQIIARLAGRAGEGIVLSDPVAGSGGRPDSDLAVATDLAIMLETSLGFGQHQRLLYRDVSDRSHLLTLDARLAAAVHARLEASYGQARTILEAEGAAYLWLASTLLRCGVLEGDELAGVVEEVRQRMTPQDHHQLAGVGSNALPTEESSAVR